MSDPSRVRLPSRHSGAHRSPATTHESWCPRQLAFRPHPTALGLDETFGDIESESESPPVVLGDLTKTLEDRLRQISGDPNPGVTNRQVA